MANILPVINSVVTVIDSVLPVVSTIAPAGVGSIINLVSEILPIAVQEATNLVTPIKNIITALQGNASTTPEQMTQLAILDAQVDAAFEAAAATDGL